jgi:hypothetical protein
MSDERRPSRSWWYRMRASEWCSDDAIQLCSLESRGTLIEITNRCHMSSDTGTLIIGGQPISPSTLDGATPDDRAALRNLAKTLRTSIGKTLKTMRELHKNGAIAVNDDGVFYSPLLAREREISRIAATKGREGGNPRLKLAVNNEDNPRGEVRGQKLEARSKRQSDVPRPPTGQAAPPKDVRPRVPPFIHTEFLQKLGDGDDPNTLIAFYSRVSDEWRGRPIGDDDPKFWRLRFAEWKGTTATRPTKAADRTAASIDALRSFAGGRT